MKKFAAILVMMLAATPALAQMQHYVVEAKKDKEAQKPAQKSFTVTPVQDCFAQLKPGEASEIRRDYDSPWLECQRRLKERAEAAEKDKAAAKDKKAQDAKGAPDAAAAQSEK